MGKTYFHDWHVLIIWQETVKEEKLDLKVTSDNSNNDDLLCQTKPWQTQKLLDPLFHHETEISNVVILRNLVLCHRSWWCPRCSSWWAPGVTGTIFPDQTCLQLRGSAAPPAPSPGGPQSPSSILSGGIFTLIISELSINHILG